MVGETLSFQGRFSTYDELTISPVPVQDPCPIWIAANPAPGRYWERSLRRVATLADGFQTCHLAPDVLRAMVNDVSRFRAEAGRPTGELPIMAYHNVNTGSDRAECLLSRNDSSTRTTGRSSLSRWSRRGPQPVRPISAWLNCAISLIKGRRPSPCVAPHSIRMASSVDCATTYCRSSSIADQPGSDVSPVGTKAPIFRAVCSRSSLGLRSRALTVGT